MLPSAASNRGTAEVASGFEALSQDVLAIVMARREGLGSGRQHEVIVVIIGSEDSIDYSSEHKILRAVVIVVLRTGSNLQATLSTST